MSNFEKTHQFLTAYEAMQLETFSDTQFQEHALTSEQVTWVESCESTSESIKEKIKQNLKEPMVFISDTQTAGKGQRDSKWFSPRGNLHMSLYLPVESHSINAKDAAHIDGRLALEVAIALLGMPMIQAAKLNPNFRLGIKWPNDLCTLSRNSTNTYPLSKFAGILIEPVSIKPKKDPNETQITLASLPRVCGVIIGIGINANHTEISHIASKPINNLQSMLRHTISLTDLAAQVCQACQKSLGSFTHHGSSLPVRFFSHDLLYDKKVEVTQFSDSITGIATGIQPDGALTVMESIENTHTVYNGSVTLLD